MHSVSSATPQTKLERKAVRSLWNSFVKVRKVLLVVQNERTRRAAAAMMFRVRFGNDSFMAVAETKVTVMMNICK